MGWRNEQSNNRRRLGPFTHSGIFVGDLRRVRLGGEMVDQEQQELHLFASRWAQWHCQCRRWAPPVPANILARMQPSKVREAPETELSADLSYFNLAVLAQEECTGKKAFYIFYLLPGANIKVAADYLGVSRNTFYKTLKTFRARAYRSYRAMMLGQEITVEETEEV